MLSVGRLGAIEFAWLNDARASMFPTHVRGGPSFDVGATSLPACAVAGKRLSPDSRTARPQGRRRQQSRKRCRDNFLGWRGGERRGRLR